MQWRALYYASVSQSAIAAEREIRLDLGEHVMTRTPTVVLVMVTLLAGPAAAQGFGRGSRMGFAPHPGFGHPGLFVRPGFGPRPGFFPQHDFVNNRFRGFFVGPGIVVAPYPAYPYPYYPSYPYPYYSPYPLYVAPP